VHEKDKFKLADLGYHQIDDFAKEDFSSTSNMNSILRIVDKDIISDNDEADMLTDVDQTQRVVSIMVAWEEARSWTPDQRWLHTDETQPSEEKEELKRKEDKEKDRVDAEITHEKMTLIRSFLQEQMVRYRDELQQTAHMQSKPRDRVQCLCLRAFFEFQHVKCTFQTAKPIPEAFYTEFHAQLYCDK
jgi:hypothetical protein